jgi:endonuclease YncB( thermonuclease family)
VIIIAAFDVPTAIFGLNDTESATYIDEEDAARRNRLNIWSGDFVTLGVGAQRQNR